MASGDIKDHEFQVPVRLVKATDDMDTWHKSQVRFCRALCVPNRAHRGGGSLTGKAAVERACSMQSSTRQTAAVAGSIVCAVLPQAYEEITGFIFILNEAVKGKMNSDPIKASPVSEWLQLCLCRAGMYGQ